MNPVDALVLAGSRAGEHDPVARAAAVRHKILAPVAGVPMVLRVLRTLAASPRVGRIVLSTDLVDELTALAGSTAGVDPARVAVVASSGSPSLSVLEQFARSGPPLLVTTADHALLTPEIVATFLDQAAERDADLVAGVVEEGTIRNRLPATRRTYLRFRDRAVSGANLFLLRTPEAERALRFWRHVERERKRPWRIAATFGPALLFAYLLRLHTFERTLERAGRRIGIRAAAAFLPYAEAAVDVDRPDDLRLAEALLADAASRSGALPS